MTLPELRSKKDHMPKSVVWILFNSKYEVKTERQKEVGKRRGEKESDRETDKQKIQISVIYIKHRSL